MIKRIHLAVGVIAFAAIFLFWASTVLAELFGNHQTIATAKRAILWGMLVLIPCMAVAGGSGFRLARERAGRLALAKKRRMMVIGSNGLLVLLPAAYYLDALASRGNFDPAFFAVQAVELLAGAANLTLMGLNIRDGLRLTGRFGQRRRRGNMAG